MSLLKKVKKIAKTVTLQGQTAKAIKKITGLSAEKQYAIGGTAAAASALLSAAANPVTETGGVISTAADGTKTLYNTGTNMGLLSTLGTGLVSGLASSAGSLLSGGVQAAGNIYGAQKSAASAKEINERQIQWERERATNAHQWEMEDLRKAGINPILAANNGASTGGISAVQPDTSGYGQAGNAISNAIGLMMEQQRLNNETKLADAQTNKLGADTGYTLEQTKWMPEQVKQQLKETGARTMQIKANTAQTAAEIDAINKDIELKQAQIWRSYHQNQLDDAQRDEIKKGRIITKFTGTKNYHPYGNMKWNRKKQRWEYLE